MDCAPFLSAFVILQRHLLKEEVIKDKQSKAEEEFTDINNRVVVC